VTTGVVNGHRRVTTGVVNGPLAGTRTRAEHLSWASIPGTRALPPRIPRRVPLVRLAYAARPQRRPERPGDLGVAHEIAVPRRQVARPKPDWADRGLAKFVQLDGLIETLRIIVTNGHVTRAQSAAITGHRLRQAGTKCHEALVFWCTRSSDIQTGSFPQTSLEHAGRLPAGASGSSPRGGGHEEPAHRFYVSRVRLDRRDRPEPACGAAKVLGPSSPLAGSSGQRSTRDLPVHHVGRDLG